MGYSLLVLSSDFFLIYLKIFYSTFVTSKVFRSRLCSISPTIYSKLFYEVLSQIAFSGLISEKNCTDICRKHYFIILNILPYFLHVCFVKICM